ncbi:hypothetical protein H0274_05560 [Altererythrobacter sp. CC-YST694]|uniref:hypothetical protein n=1 Tax=Altererythrobacter sp. CC-YST694 TaxID=2755038 RepID=UPI001D00D615|nr:hypothetical protein [Altererythrobacter sp. CC-YST694]MCB5424716.1 hypothetical protein [Altererythrobacter sp. CC-YST694]
MIDRIRLAALTLPALLALSGPAWGQEQASPDSETAYQQGLACEAIYSLLGENSENAEDEAEYAAFMAETWHDFLSSRFPDGFNERHEPDFISVSNSLVETLNAMDDDRFNAAVDELLSTCGSMEADPGFLG